MIRVIVADDREMLEQVSQILLGQDIQVVATAIGYESTALACHYFDCDVIVLDDFVSYPCEQLIRQLRDANVITPVLVTSINPDLNLVQRALGSGAGGFLLKADFQDHLVPAIRALDAGETYLSPLIRRSG